jgi:ABC-type transporter Mla MlaB component
VRSIVSNKKEEGTHQVDQVIKDQEILSERISTLNEHIKTQKTFFESKVNTIAEQERTLLTLAKDVNLLKTTVQDFELYVKNQFDHVQRSTHMGSGHNLKEFGDLIKEKMDNFFEERKNQFQKIEIELDELKHMDTAKQNILLRLQKEFSDRLTDANLRLTEQKNNVTDNMLHAENTKHNLLELEKAIQELKIQLQDKQHDFYNRQDIRLQSFEDRFNKISEALQQKTEEVSHADVQKQMTLHETRMAHLVQEIEKLKHSLKE